VLRRAGLTGNGYGEAFSEFSIRHRTGTWRDPLRRRLLALADVTTISLAIGVVAATGGFSLRAAFWTLLLLPLWLVLAKLHGLYDNDHQAFRHLTVYEIPRLLSWGATGVAGLAAFLSLVPPEPHVGALIQFWLLVVVLAPTLRAAMRALWRSWVPPEQTLIVGSGPLARAVTRKLQLFRDIHVEVVRVVDDGEVDAASTSVKRGDGWIAELLSGRAPEEHVERIVLATETVAEPLMAALVPFCRQRAIKLSVVPPTRGVFGTAVQLNHVADLPMIEYNTWNVSRSTMALKRVFDAVCSGFALIVLAPFFALVAIAIRLDSKGPVFFKQLRAGRNGRPFKMVKFRTMVADAESKLAELVDLDSLPTPMFKFSDDPRVTRVGRRLRRWSVDELPQLFNVLRGDMSLVGPRPEQIDLVERYGPEARVRLALKPGITGPMQVYGRGELSFDERLAVERAYIEDLSLRRDMHLLLLTISAVVRGDGAF
jgi:exopolysaccharide biosynthesis polyprenyl glycosylphosphotransferase